MPLSLDHIVIAVTDLDAAMRDYEALGFTVLPGGEHPRGSRNALIVFEDGSYLEIIAFGRPVPDFRWWQVLSHCGSGLVDYALLPEMFDDALVERAGAGARASTGRSTARGCGRTGCSWSGRRRARRSPMSPSSAAMSPRASCASRWARPAEHRNGVVGVAGVTAAVHDLGSVLGALPRPAGAGADRLRRRARPRRAAAQFQLGEQMLSLVEPQPGAAR